MSNEKEEKLREQVNSTPAKQKELKAKVLESLNNKTIKLTSASAEYLRKLIELKVSVLNSKEYPSNLSTLINSKLFAEIADYNFCNRPSKLIEDTLTEGETNYSKNFKITSTKHFYKTITEETFYFSNGEDTIELFKIYHDPDNCYGQEYLIDLHKIEADPNEISNLLDDEKSKLNLINKIYVLLLEDFGIKNYNGINAKGNILSRYSVNTSLYSVAEVKPKVRTK